MVRPFHHPPVRRRPRRKLSEIAVHGYSYGGYVSSPWFTTKILIGPLNVPPNKLLPSPNLLVESTNYGNIDVETDTYKDTSAPRDGAINHLDPSDRPPHFFPWHGRHQIPPLNVWPILRQLSKAGIYAQSILVPNRGHG